MKRTFLKIEKEDGFPLEIEINGRHLSGALEQVAFFASVALAAIGILLLLVYVVLPLLGIALGLIFGIIGIGLLIVGVGVVIAIIGGLIGGMLEGRSRGGRRDDDWDR